MVCKNCGKDHDGSFGSGIFCSRSCANTRKHTTETKKKISESLYGKRYGNAKHDRYFIRIKKCPICNKEEIVRSRTDSKNPIIKTCSKKCFKMWLSCKIKESGAGGYREGSGYGKSGRYKNIYCASTYELIFLAYHLENGNNIKRCKKSFLYNFKGKQHSYHPDFEIDNIIYEIKGYETERTPLKINSVKSAGYEIKLLFYNEIKLMETYLKNKYNIKHITKLYDPVD